MTALMPFFPIEEVRARFPALRDGGRIYLDGPRGTQVCAPAISAIVAHLEGGTANSGGLFRTSIDTDALSAAAHAAMADLLGADPGEIAFGPNMTSLTLSVSRALARDWRKGDELIVTRLDHDADVAPWLAVAEDRGMTVRWIDFIPATGVLDLDALPAMLGERTRLVAVDGAGNAIGTVNDIPAISAIVYAHSNALLFVDAVQSVPHLATDVRALGCDLLVCSPYKFFGPHQACCGAAATCSRGCALTRSAPHRAPRPHTASRLARPRSRGRPLFSARSIISNGWARGSRRTPSRGPQNCARR